MSSADQEQLLELLHSRRSLKLLTQADLARMREKIIINLVGPENPATMSWLQRLGVRFDLSPAVLGALALSMATLLISGIVVALQEGPLYRPDRPLAPLQLGPMASSFVAWPNPPLLTEPKPVPGPEAVPRSTEPVTTLDAGGFPEPLPAIQPVKYTGAAKPN